MSVAAPPQSPWGMNGVEATTSSGSSVSAVGVIMDWIGWISWFGLVVTGLALVGFAAMLAIDKDRGRSISASAPHVELVKFALGIAMISAAGALASTFYSLIF